VTVRTRSIERKTKDTGSEKYVPKLPYVLLRLSPNTSVVSNLVPTTGSYAVMTFVAGPRLAAAALRALPYDERPAFPSTTHQATLPKRDL